MSIQKELNLTNKQVEFIEETFSNNEVSPDEELVELFVEDGIEKEAAEKLMEFRQSYLLNIFIGNDTPIRNGTQVGFPF